MSTVSDIERAMYAWAPRELAEDWDNVGLLVGSGAAEVRRVLVALDVTERVADEAIARGAELIVAHHPLMNCRWHEVQNVVDDNAQGRTIIKLIRNGVAAICMHTNLDAADGGVNDILAGRLGLSELSMLSEERIGRVGSLEREMPLEAFLGIVKRALNCPGLRYRDGGRPVRRVAVGGGSCFGYLGNALSMGCDTFVTADVKYHDFLDANGINLIDAGHFETEDPVCEAIGEHLRASFPQLELLRSEVHADPIRFF